MSRVIITGIGSISSMGNNTESLWGNILRSNTGVGKITYFDSSEFNVKIACEIREYQCKTKVNKCTDKVVCFAVDAIKEALEDANLTVDELKNKRIALIIGSCTGGALTLDEIDDESRINKLKLIQIPVSNVSNNIAFELGVGGINLTFTNACAAGTVAINYGASLIESNRVDIAIVGGSDTFSKFVYGGFNSLKSLSKDGCSPFSKSDGLTLGEGAGILILEGEESCLGRIKPKGIVYSGKTYSEGYHITSPNKSGEGIIKAIKETLMVNALESNDIDYINAHGTGTSLNDEAEINGFKSVFSENTNISSSKSFLGHTLGAAGALEGVITVKALSENIVPPTINFNYSDDKLKFTPNIPIEKKINFALSNSLAFGGNNTAVIFGKYSEELKKDMKLSNKRVFIKSIGITSHLGKKEEEYIRSLREIYNGNEISCNDNIDLTDLLISKGFRRKLDRFSILTLESVLSLIGNGILSQEEIESSGLILGTCDGTLTSIYEFNKILKKDGLNMGNARMFPNTVINAALGYTSIYLKNKGETASIAAGLIGGLASTSYAYDLIKNENRNNSNVIAIGIDELSSPIRRAYSLLNERLKLSEGSASILLTDKIDTETYCEILGYGYGYEKTKPGRLDETGNALKNSILNAIKASNINIDEIDGIFQGANGDGKSRSLESRIYMNIFSEGIPIFNIREITFEGRAFSSMLQVATAALFLKGNDVKLKAYNLKNEKINMASGDGNIKTLLVTGFAYGGSCCSIVLRKL